MKKVVLGALLLAAAGCKSNPYCLNCKDSGNGVIAPEDMTPPDDLAEAADLSGPDLLGQGGGPCAPTNGGVEKCDGIDNDCNGKIDDVNVETLVGDPNNCGACGNVCKYVHAGGQCVGGWDGGMPTCKMGSCQPGYVDLDGDPTNGCEYTCAQTNGGVEKCDGIDNNCDGRVDETFTTTWLDAAKQKPAYDKDANNCGQCAGVCNLGQGTIMGCQAPAAGQLGQCVVLSCFNGLDANGVHQTYRHDPSKGPLGTTGCEYHCPKSASQLGVDCNPDGACTFPAEVCNAIDDDCNFLVDDNLTDPGIGVACPDGAPGKLCTSTGANATCGKGVCVAGTYQCVSGTLTCSGSVGPSPELCDAIDNNCDGQVDEPFTATWKDAAKQQPRYDSDPSNCGGCTTAATSFRCALPNATNICRLYAGDSIGSCAVAACNSGWNYVTHTDSNPASPTCDVVTTGQESSTQTTTGRGCFYKCASATPSTEVCDGSDNDCDGCIDNGLTAPDICAKQGVCFNAGIKATCGGASGWKCDYSKIPNISIDSNGNLTAAEKQCDTLDNNCNGPCDENFPDTQLLAGGTCTNAPRAAKSCTAGLGVCQATAPYACANSGGPTPPPYNDIEVCSATPNTAAATDEKCNGKDDDCDGLVDESTDDPGGKKGWHDPMVQLPSGVWVYQYEASRPDATGLKSGSSGARACSNLGVIPWSNVTLAQAQAACAAIKDSTGKPLRLCTAAEWQTACDKGNTGNNWSLSNATSTYVSGVCNDQGETEQRCIDDTQCAGAAGSCDTSLHRCKCSTSTDCNVGFACSSGVCTGSGVWATGVSGTTSSEQCYTTWGTAGAHDMTGNLFEWTSTNVVLKSGSSASITNASGGQATLSGLTNIYPTDVGAQIILTSGTAGDSGTFTVVSVVSSTSVVINDAAAVAASGITWQFVYNKVRGGSYSSTSGGDTCEFDFDIQKASFSNTDLGFRCCADNQP